MTASPERECRLRTLEMVRALAVTDFRLKYNDSALGYAWSMLSPLTMLAIYYFVFRHVIGVRQPGYQIYLLVGVVFWSFFQDCTFSGLSALSARQAVLKAIRVPPVLVITAAALSRVITILINTTVLVVFLALWGKLSPLFPLVVIPIVCLVCFATGVSALVALAYVRFRDMGLVWGIVLQAWFWLTPVVYSLDIDRPLAEVMYLNPVARCLYLLRWFLVYDYMPATRFVVITIVFCLVTFAAAMRLLLARQDEIAEKL